jgi:hypothetical protein
VKRLPKFGEHMTTFNKKQPRCPFRVYLDGESQLRKTSLKRGAGTQIDNQHVYTHIGVQFLSDYQELLADEYKNFPAVIAWSTACAGWTSKPARLLPYLSVMSQ